MPGQLFAYHFLDAFPESIDERLTQDWSRRPMSMFAINQRTVTFVLTRALQVPSHRGKVMSLLFDRQRHAFGFQHLEQAVRPDLRLRNAFAANTHRERTMSMQILNLPLGQLLPDIDALHVRDLAAHIIDAFYYRIDVDDIDIDRHLK